MSQVTYLDEGNRVGIRPFRPADGPEFVTRVHESRALHHPWMFPPDTIEAYEPWAARLGDGDSRVGFLVCERAGGAVAGFVNVNNIVRGASSAEPSATPPSPTPPAGDSSARPSTW